MVGEAEEDLECELILFGEEAEGGEGCGIELEGLEENHEVFQVVFLVDVLQFFADRGHAFIVDDDHVQVADNFSDKLLVVDAFDNLHAHAPAELVAFLDDCELPEDLLGVELVVFGVAFEEQEEHLLHEQLEVLLSDRSVLDDGVDVLDVGVAKLAHQVLDDFLDLGQDLVVIVLEHELHPPQGRLGRRGRLLLHQHLLQLGHHLGEVHVLAAVQQLHDRHHAVVGRLGRSLHLLLLVPHQHQHRLQDLVEPLHQHFLQQLLLPLYRTLQLDLKKLKQGPEPIERVQLGIAGSLFSRQLDESAYHFSQDVFSEVLLQLALLELVPHVLLETFEAVFSAGTETLFLVSHHELQIFEQVGQVDQ